MTSQRSHRAGFVYFVQEAELLRIKIGFTSSHPGVRLQTLATASSQALSYLGFQPGDEALEKKLHAKFKSTHCRNEWFHPSEELLDYINNLSYGSEFARALRQFVLAPGQVRPPNSAQEQSSPPPNSGHEMPA